MTKDEIYNAPKYAGIYCFRNKMNGKCYIGQSIKLRKRLLHHINNLENNRYDAPIYRAFKKYGLENFELIILKTYRDALSKEVKDKLDEDEKFYIKEYNSYAPNGYNQTLGGDGGVLGYKFTPEQIAKQKIITHALSGQNKASWIYAYDIETKTTYMAITAVYLSQRLNIPVSVLHSACRSSYIVCYNKYVIGHSEEEIKKKLKLLEQRKSKLNTDYTGDHNNLKGVSNLIFYKNYYEFLCSLPKGTTLKQIAKLCGVSKPTVDKRNQKLRKLGYQLPCIASHKPIQNIKVTNIETQEVIIMGISQFAKNFNLKISSARKQVQHTNLYKKKYKIERI